MDTWADRTEQVPRPEYTLGMVGPLWIEEFRGFLDPASIPGRLPRGLGGAPVNLLCRELLRRGHRLMIFTTDPTIHTEVVVQGPQLKICIVPEWPHTGRRFFKQEIEGLRRAIARERPDVLHAQWTYEFALAALGTDIPHVVTAHDAPLSILRLNFIPYRMVRTLMAVAALRKSRRVVAVSPYVVEHLHRFRFHAHPVEVIPNGLPASLFDRARPPRVEGTPPTFASVLVGWTAMKNGQVAIDAFARVRSELPDARLIMFGAGHGPGEGAQQYATRRGIAGGIEFAGHVDYATLQERLARQTDVLIHPSLEESHGMALIEAMSVGIPVIGGKTSGAVPWTLDNGRAGALVDVRRADELAEIMMRLARSPDEAHALGERGRLYAREQFHIRRVADAYENIYKMLAHEHA